MSHHLFREDGDNFRSVTVALAERELRVYTQDMGKAPEEFWGAEDYEFWIAIKEQNFGRLLLALIREFFDGDPKATDRLREICRKHDVQHEWMNWV